MRRFLKYASLALLALAAWFVLAAPPLPVWIRAYRSDLTQVAVASDGAWLATAETDGPYRNRNYVVRILDARTGTVAATLPDEFGSFVVPAFSPDGARVAVGFDDPRTGDATLAVYDRRSGERVWRRPLGPAAPAHVGLVHWRGNALMAFVNGVALPVGTPTNIAIAVLADTGAELRSFQCDGAALSRDGRTAFVRRYPHSEDRPAEISAVPLVAGGLAWKRAAPFGDGHLWPNDDGTSLAYRTNDSSIRLSTADGSAVGVDVPNVRSWSPKGVGLVVEGEHVVGACGLDGGELWRFPAPVLARYASFLKNGSARERVATFEPAPLFLPRDVARRIPFHPDWGGWPGIVRHRWHDAETGSVVAEFTSLRPNASRLELVCIWLPAAPPGLQIWSESNWFSRLAAYEDPPRKDWRVRLPLALGPWLALAAWRRFRRRGKTAAA